MDEQLQRKNFLKMLGQCQGSILKLCLQYTDRHPDSVNDLYQEIVYNLWRAYSRFGHSSKANTWVYRTAMNTINMRLREQYRTPTVVALDEHLCETIADDSGDELVIRLYELIDRLEDDERDMLNLYLDKVPQREIAVIYGMSEWAVNQKIHRIKMKLKNIHENEQQE